MELPDVNSMFINGFMARQPIRLRSVTFSSGRPAGCVGMFEDESPRKSSGKAEDERNNYGYWQTIYLLPDGYLKGYGIGGVNVITLHGGVIACIMPWASVDYIEVFNREGWRVEIPECLLKLSTEGQSTNAAE